MLEFSPLFVAFLRAKSLLTRIHCKKKKGKFAAKNSERICCKCFLFTADPNSEESQNNFDSCLAWKCVNVP